MDSKRKGYSYIRFSTPEQAQGDSYRRQHEAAQRYAAVPEHNIELDDSLDLRDLGVSAFRGLNAKTGKLGLFLDAVSTGKVKPGSVLLVDAIDRLSRMEPANALNQLMRLLDHGIASTSHIRHMCKLVSPLPDLLAPHEQLEAPPLGNHKKHNVA